jgi:hypothetical protein
MKIGSGIGSFNKIEEYEQWQNYKCHHVKDKRATCKRMFKRISGCKKRGVYK